MAKYVFKNFKSFYTKNSCNGFYQYNFLSLLKKLWNVL